MPSKISIKMSAKTHGSAKAIAPSLNYSIYCKKIQIINYKINYNQILNTNTALNEKYSE